MYAKYVNNQQRELQAINDDIKKIAVVKYSMNCTYLCVSWSRRRNGCPYCSENMWWKKNTTVNSSGLSAVRTANVL